jgi:hypothetical protein
LTAWARTLPNQRDLLKGMLIKPGNGGPVKDCRISFNATSILSWAQTGWFFLSFQSEHRPGLAKAVASRYFYLR